MSDLQIPAGYNLKPPQRQIPLDAVALVEQPSRDGQWIDLIAVMPDGARLYVTTKPAVFVEEVE